MRSTSFHSAVLPQRVRHSLSCASKRRRKHATAQQWLYRSQLNLERLEERVVLAAGFLDPSFGDGGIVTTDFKAAIPNSFFPVDISIVQSDNKMIVTGYSWNTVGGYNMEVVRYNSDGVLDQQFGDAGRVVIDFSSTYSSNDFPRAMLVQPDGKIIVAGVHERGSGSYESEFALARLNTDGSLDDGGPSDLTPGDSFGVEGKVVTDFPGSYGSPWKETHDEAMAIALQPDGKIVVAGKSNLADMYTPMAARFALARYNSDGSPDLSFGNEGQLTTIPLEGQGNDEDFHQARAVAVQSDGTIVVAGNTITANGLNIAIVSYKANGTLNSSFGDAGVVTADLGQYGRCNAMHLLSDGSIVVAGSADGHSLALTRFTRHGSLDTTFGQSGVAVVGIGESRWLYADDISMVAQPDGKYVLASGFWEPTGGPLHYGSILARFNADGNLDDGSSNDSTPADMFGLRGMVIGDFGSWDVTAYGLALQGSERLVTCGWAQQNQEMRIGIARYNSDGTHDGSFGVDGLVITSVTRRGTDSPRVMSVTLPEGDILVAGYSEQWSGSGITRDIALAKYDSNGTLDATFGTDGLVTTDLGASEWLSDMLVQPADGKIVVGILQQLPTSHAEYLIRYNADGTLDEAFGSAGIVAITAGHTVQSIEIQSDGRIVVGGYSWGHRQDFAIARYNVDGSLDDGSTSDSTQGDAFGINGVTTLDFVGTDDTVNRIAIQADGTIIVSGSANDDFALARFNPDGSLDQGFGDAGKVTRHLGYYDQPIDLAIQTDGNILVAGTTQFSGSPGKDAVILRYDQRGILDSTFGTNGLVTADLGDSNDSLASIVVQPDGRIVLAGNTSVNRRGVLVRFNGDGTPDDGSAFDSTPADLFGTSGRTTTQIGSNVWALACNIGMHIDGTILVLGWSVFPETDEDFVLLRYFGDTRPGSLEDVVAAGETEVIGYVDPTDVDDWVLAIGGDGTPENPGLPPNPNPEQDVVIQLNLAPGDYGEPRTVVVPDGYVLVIEGQPGVIIEGSSPALILERGRLVVQNGVTLINATDAPTILVLGGVLTVRNSFIHESTGGNQPAIKVLGGSVELVGNTLTTHGDGQFIENLSPAAIITTGNEYHTDSETLYVPADVVVFGTPGDDNIDFLPGNDAGEVNIDATGLPRAILTPTGRLVAFGGDGNDTIQLSSSLSLTAWLYGEKGNDRLRGAEANDVLFGGFGDDVLAGHAGRDFLVGGLGADRLVGNADDDIVIAGSPNFGTSAIEAIMSFWSGIGEANTRRLAVLNYMSAHSLTVADDTDKDLLTGSSGTDWFFANLEGGGVLDKVTDLDDKAFAMDLDFILAG